MKKTTFTTKDNLRLTGVWHLPEKTTNKAIILAHGLTVDKNEDGVFVALSEFLKDYGFAVFRFDFRGHGESEGESVDMTIAGELLDLEAAVEQARKEYSNISLLGASFGGGIATLYAADNQNKLKSLVLWNPVLNYDHCFINPYLPWLRDKIVSIRRDLVEKGYAEIGSRKYKVGKKLYDEMEVLRPYELLSKINIPTLIIHGDKDTYVSYKDSKEYVKLLLNGQFVTIKNAEHGFHEPEENTRKASEATLEFFRAS